MQENGLHAGWYRSQGLYIHVYVKNITNVPVFNNGAKKHFLAWPFNNFHEFKSTHQQFITLCIELENVGGFRKAYMHKTEKCRSVSQGLYEFTQLLKPVKPRVRTLPGCGHCSWASSKDRLRPLRFSIQYICNLRVFCSDGFPCVLTSPFSTPAFSAPPSMTTTPMGANLIMNSSWTELLSTRYGQTEADTISLRNIRLQWSLSTRLTITN